MAHSCRTLLRLRRRSPGPRAFPGSLAAAVAALPWAVCAQSPASPGTTLPTVTISVPIAPAPSVAGFGHLPLQSLPLQATVIEREQIDGLGARRLADLIKLEPSASDSYNSVGYWDYLTLRGYVLDQRFNYRREGLPISAETSIPLGNKERVEILKGTSGIQAGTSAPGGLVNYVVKRPTAEPLRSVTLHAGERGTFGAALDLSDRAGADQRFGYRLNLAHEDRQPRIDDYGHLRRSLAAIAAEWRLAPGAALEAEMEWSRQVGASLPGYSLTGDVLPGTRRPANLNNQPWSLPNEFDGLSGTLRYSQALGGGWRWVSQLGTQRLTTDDRVAFPFGFDCHPTSGFTFCDRYSPTGDFDFYDFRSENERRRSDALQSSVQGQVQTGALRHDLRAGVLASRLRYDFPRQTNNFVGTGNIDGSRVTPPNPALNDEATNRTERSLEVFVNDAIDWGQGWTTWLGLRSTRLQRASVRTDGDRATSYRQTVTTPWLAASYAWRPRQLVYASWGQGTESAVVPGRPDRYPNAGEALPALKSRQWEIGLKLGGDQTDWSLAYFDTDRPAVTDAPPLFARDGSDHHRGIELAVIHEAGPWLLRGGAMLLDAQREGSSDAGLNGRRPINVPERTLKMQTRYRMSSLPGLDLHADLTHEGRRSVLADGSIELPSWTRVDAAAVYRQHAAGADLTWRLGIDNLFDRRAWKESPLQFGHVYLFPLDARTLRLSLQTNF